jgi:hypothetical protein
MLAPNSSVVDVSGEILPLMVRDDEASKPIRRAKFSRLTGRCAGCEKHSEFERYDCNTNQQFVGGLQRLTLQNAAASVKKRTVPSVGIAVVTFA